MALSLLDLLGVVLIGLVGAIAVTTVQSQPAPTSVTSITDRLGLQSLDPQQLVLVLSAAAAGTLLIKSVVSSILLRRVFLFLANRQALVAARLSKALLSQPLLFLQRRSSQETAFALINGAGAATIQVLGQMVVAATELAVLVVLGAGLLLISPWVALGAIAFFSVVAFGLQRAMGGWAVRVGRVTAEADIESLHTVQESLAAYREICVTDRRDNYVDRIQQVRWRAARVAADSMFIGMFPKYLFEAALVVGGFVLAGVLFATQDAASAVGTLALFVAAGTRVMPSLLRLQGAALGLRGAAAIAAPTFALAADLGNPLEVLSAPVDSAEIRERVRRGDPAFVPSLTLTDVSFRYPGAGELALDRVSLLAQPGQSVALVGRSGSGKSTLADIVLGVLEPDTGEILLGGLAPQVRIAASPGVLGYVPQSVVLADGTIRSNVALGLPEDAIDDDMVWEALERAHLASYLRDSRQGLDTPVGEHGVKLSGGQRQRLGIARALYTRPRLLVLDEATSALDAETERAITATIAALDGDVTTLIIAHRLSTVRDADLVLYLDGGKVLASGSFEAVVAQVPSFSKQAALMGL